MVNIQNAVKNINAATPDIRTAISHRAVAQFQISVGPDFKRATISSITIRKCQAVHSHFGIDGEQLHRRRAIADRIAANSQAFGSRAVKYHIVIENQWCHQTDDRRIIRDTGHSGADIERNVIAALGVGDRTTVRATHGRSSRIIISQPGDDERSASGAQNNRMCLRDIRARTGCVRYINGKIDNRTKGQIGVGHERQLL